MINLQKNLRKSLMTHYDKLIDSITNEIYKLYLTANNWNEIEAKKTSHKILTFVEEFQQKRATEK